MTVLTLLAVKASANNPLKVTALGDSITSLGGFISIYNRYVTTDLKYVTQTNNLGVAGWTSGALANALTDNSTMRTSIVDSKIVLVEIGINDFFNYRGAYQSGTCGGVDNQDCLRSMVANFKTNWDRIFTQINTLVDPTKTAIRTQDIYYSVAAADQLPTAPYNNSFPVLNFYLQQMNAYIHSSSQVRNIPVANVHLAYNGINGDENPAAKGYLLPDAIHPTTLGSTVIADELRKLGYAPLTLVCADVNGDGKVNSTDMLLVYKNFNTNSSQTNFNPTYDVNGDGKVNSIDILLMSQQFNRRCVISP